MVSLTQRAIAAISYEVEPLDADAAGGGAVRAGRQRGAAAAGRRSRALAAILETPLVARSYERTTGRRGRCWCTRPAQRAADGGRRWSHVIDGPGEDRRAGRVLRGPGPGDGGGRAGPGRAAAASSSTSATAGPAQRSRPALVDQVVGALAAAPPDRLGRPAGRAASLPGRVLGRRRRRGGRRRRDPAGGALRRCSTSCRPARGPSTGRSRPRA